MIPTKTKDPLAAYPEILTMKEVASILRMSVDWVSTFDHGRERVMSLKVLN